MDKQFMLVIIVAMVLVFSGIMTSEYLSSKDNKVMADSGLEQCPAVPTWMNSGKIWVKDCEKYMKTYISVQDKD